MGTDPLAGGLDLRDALELAWAAYLEAHHGLQDEADSLNPEPLGPPEGGVWGVAPEQVASFLAERASEAFRRSQGSDTYSEEEMTRIRRLTNGALEALEDGDYPRAIRRAYYACQLLGVGPG